MANFAPLNREGCVLVVIDFQEKLLPAIYDFTAVLDRAVKMVTAAHTMNVPVLFTQHYTPGLGQTHEALRKLQPEFSYIEKNIFNSFGVPDFAAKLEALQAKTLVMLGIGWNFGFIGATAMLTRASRPEERSRIQGLNDLVVFGGVFVASLSSGGLMNCAGVTSAAAGWSAVNLAMVPFLVLAGGALIWLVLRPKEA